MSSYSAQLREEQQAVSRAYGRLGGRHFPFFDREQTDRRQSAERIVEFEIDCFTAIVELYHFGFDQAVGCINGIEDIGVFERASYGNFYRFAYFGGQFGAGKP